MTINEKKQAIKAYCATKPFCSWEQEIPCPLYTVGNTCYSDVDDETIERNFNLISAMPDYHGEKETNGVEHDGCSECRYFECDEESEPCVRCKGTSIYGTDEYKNRPDCFELSPSTPLTSLSSVDHPTHYNQGNMETIDEMLLIFGVEAVMHFCLCNAWKYRARAAYKGDSITDMNKSDWYLAKYKELEDKYNVKGNEWNKLP